MHIEPITYEDLDGVNVTDQIHFNMTKTELLEYVGAAIDVKNISAENEKEMMDYAKKKLIRKLDFSTGADIIGFLKDLILRAYGVRSEDGKSFIKVFPDGTRLADQFVQTLAFDALMSRFTDDPEKANEFMLAVMPRSIADAVRNDKEETKPAIGVISTPIT